MTQKKSPAPAAAQNINPQLNEKIQAFRALAKRSVTIIPMWFFLYLIAPKDLAVPMIITTAMATTPFFIFLTLTIFYPEKFTVVGAREKLWAWHSGLHRHQQLYLNLVLFFPMLLYVRIFDSPKFILGMTQLYIVYALIVAAYDVVRIYRLVSKTYPGKLVIAIAFAVGSNLAFSFSGWLIGAMTHVPASTFPHTLSFLAIAMIPVLVIGVGLSFMPLAILSAPFVVMASMMQKDAPGLVKLLTGRKFERPAGRYVIITFFFQFFFYSVIFMTAPRVLSTALQAYDKDISLTVAKSIYAFDMYPGTECKDVSGVRYAALGDENYLLAHMTTEEVHFQEPRKCSLKEE